MPGGALLQLVAFGAQDVYLTGSPQVTFFKQMHKRYTNFAMEAIQQTISGNGNPGGLVSVTLARTGDLIGDMWVVLQPTNTSSANLTSTNSTIDMNWVAERAFSSVEVFIGGQSIDKHYQTWFRLYSEVFLNLSKKLEYGRLTSIAAPNNVAQTSTGYVYLPLIFWFNKNPGLFLPLIALQYHEVRIDFTLSAAYANYFGNNPFQVWGNYMYLEKEERDKFAKVSHEYLIEQVQFVNADPVGTSTENAPSIIRMQFNHPVKELIWCYQNQYLSSNLNAMWNFSSGVSNVNVSVDCNKLAQSSTFVLPSATGCPLLYTPPLFTTSNIYLNSATATGVVSGTSLTAGSSFSVSSNILTGNCMWVESGLPVVTSNIGYGQEVGPLHQLKFIFNGTDRANIQPAKYFNQYQPYVYHAGCPYPGIYSYSFALKPEDMQPSGTCNFSRIDMAQTAVYFKTGMPSLNQNMFAINYNVLRIASGLGGVAFAN